MFVLGQPATLQVGDVGIGGATIVAQDIGRSIQRIPGSHDVSFVQRLDDGGSEIRRLDPATGESERLIEGIAGGDFHAWTPQGTLLMSASGSPNRIWQVDTDTGALSNPVDLVFSCCNWPKGLGFLEMPPIALEARSWGRIKATYRGDR